ncbi:fibronectin type 3 domain-containing protein [Clostridiales Family XIII bacterium PM5-7]
MKRIIVSIVLSLTLVLSGICTSWADTSSLVTSQAALEKLSGKACTSNITAAASIDYVLAKYKDGSIYPGAGECWGYAEKVSSILASSRSTKFYTGLKFSKTNFKNKCLNVKAGTHIRLSREKKFNGAKGHSVILLKVSEEKTYWIDNNNLGYGRVGHHYGTLDDFMNCYSQYGYINMVAETKSYKVSAKPTTASSASNKGGSVTLTWLKTSGASRYEVYRSYSKTGTYKRIGKTTKTTYTDATLALGKTAYYKIRAVKKNGKTTGNITSRKIILSKPIISLTNDSETNDPVISWKAVPKADKYRIYYYSQGDGKYKLLATTTACEYRDTKASREGRVYAVKAIYSKRAAGNSNYSNSIWGHRTLPAPETPIIEGTLDEYGEAIISWNAVARGCYYEVYRSQTINGEYEYLGTAWDCNYVDYDRYEGEQWYYKVTACNEDGISGQFSQVIWL